MGMNVSVNWDSRMTFEANTDSGHSVVIDAGAPAGDNKGPRPTELLLCGVGACSSMDVVETMQELGLHLDSLKVEVRGERPSVYPMGFTDIYLNYIVEGSDIDEATLQTCLLQSINLYCAAGLSLKATKHVSFVLNGVSHVVYE